jgi:acetyl-CoA/propionyl-CoA carboxylase biotin carboxyl carrier protein
LEQPISAHKSGVFAALKAEIGQTVTSGAVLLEVKDHSGDTATTATTE